MRSTWAKAAVLAASVALLVASCTREGGQETQEGEEGQTQQQPKASLLETVAQRGELRCGVNQTVPGFGFETAQGEIEGFDVDHCRAIAAAVVGDAEAIQLVPIDAEERFNALRAGQFDVLVRNTTWTSSRDGTEGVAFAHPNFYDGQAMMVRKGEYASIDDMNDTAICVTTGTTTELNLADYFGARNLQFQAVTFEENPQLQEAFISKRCDGWTSDRSQLAGIRSQWPQEQGGPESLEILPDVMSKEPLAPGVLEGDPDWHDAVNWVVNGLILAEELGVTQANVDQMASNPPNPSVAALLGVPFEAEEETLVIENGLGLEDDFMQNVLKAVGNYGEIFNRHVGPDSPLGLDRGINALWTDGGIQYGIPFR